MSNIKITELNFFEIKENLKNFLKQQEEFKDYDFDGSSIQVLLDILSSNTYYNSIYQNMISNESFLDSSVLRESVVSRSKVLGYTPRSKRSSQSRIKLSLREILKSNGTMSQPSYIILPQYSTFQATSNNRTYTFTNLESQILNSSSTYVDSQGVIRKIYSGSFDLFQGVKTEQIFIIDYKNNPDQRFIINNQDVDLETLIVKVKESVNSENFIYNKSENVANVTPEDRVYWVIENENGNYEIQFGNGRIGKKLDDSAEVFIEYLVSAGSISNKFKSFTWDDIITIEDKNDSSNNSKFALYDIETLEESYGGLEKESINEIKFSAPKYYETQNRAVTSLDYRFLIENKYKSVDSVKTWGGEDNNPPEFGKVFISIKPKSGYFITDYTKQNIKEQIVKKYNVVTIEPEIVDPYFTYIDLETNIKYNLKDVNYGENYIKNLIIENLKLFNEQNLGKFDSYFRFSKLVCVIDDSHNSIKSNASDIRIKNTIDLFLDESYTYFTNFNNSIQEGSLISSEFKYLGEEGCFLEDGDGKISIFYMKNGNKTLLKREVGSIDYIEGKINFPNLTIQNNDEGNSDKKLELSFRVLQKDLVPDNNQIFVLDLNNLDIKFEDISNQFLTE